MARDPFRGRRPPARSCRKKSALVRVDGAGAACAAERRAAERTVLAAALGGEPDLAKPRRRGSPTPRSAEAAAHSSWSRRTTSPGRSGRSTCRGPTPNGRTGADGCASRRRTASKPAGDRPVVPPTKICLWRRLTCISGSGRGGHAVRYALRIGREALHSASDSANPLKLCRFFLVSQARRG
jgi:hypothetical protein